MKKLILSLSFLISMSGIANTDLKDLKIITYDDLSSQEVKIYCKKASNVDSNICLMTREKAEKYCLSKGLKLPSILDFAIMASSYGAYVGSKDCGQSRTCQNIKPINDENFFYNSGGADIENILPNYWFHTSSLREEGANFQFGSNSGFIGSSSDKNPGNVTCI